MNKYVLREKIYESIGNNKIKAAVFYTFNFDPKFFENYILPITQPTENFGNDEILNKITWRTCLQKNRMVPVTVYCDYFAKFDEDAPQLGYDVNCVKLNTDTNTICNYHPKVIFLLLDNDTLVWITGSGNVTYSGWCDNIENFVVKIIEKEKRQPNKSRTNNLQRFIQFNSDHFSKSSLSNAENLIYNFLRYSNQEFPFFSSDTGSLHSYLEREIFDKYDIHKVEIVSPYFSKKTDLVTYLVSKDIALNILLPRKKDNEVLIDKETCVAMLEDGVNWCYWKTQNLNLEQRNLHAKIIRLYSDTHVFTINGSINFTQPAWNAYTPKAKASNYEFATIQKEAIAETQTLLQEIPNFESKIDSFIFYNIPNPENPEVEDESYVELIHNRNVPELDFEIDWLEKTVQISYGKKSDYCTLKHLTDVRYQIEGIDLSTKPKYIQLDKIAVKKLAKNALLHISQKRGEKQYEYKFYPSEVNIDYKPLGFNITRNMLLELWQYHDDEQKVDEILEKLLSDFTNESGIITNDKKRNGYSYLNEMALYFNGLINLEKLLFKTPKTQKDYVYQFDLMHEYLASENIRSVSFFIRNLEVHQNDASNNEAMEWMIFKIIQKNLIQKAKVWSHKKVVDKKKWKSFVMKLDQIDKELNDKLDSLIEKIDYDEKKLNWLINEL